MHVALCFCNALFLSSDQTSFLTDPFKRQCSYFCTTFTWRHQMPTAMEPPPPGCTSHPWWLAAFLLPPPPCCSTPMQTSCPSPLTSPACMPACAAWRRRTRPWRRWRGAWSPRLRKPTCLSSWQEARRVILPLWEPPSWQACWGLLYFFSVKETATEDIFMWWFINIWVVVYQYAVIYQYWCGGLSMSSGLSLFMWWFINMQWFINICVVVYQYAVVYQYFCGGWSTSCGGL